MKEIRTALIVYYANYYSTFLKAKKALEGHVKLYMANRENEKYIKRHAAKVDAVLVVGGDGTLLRASHFIGKTPTLHISSGTDVHEAFYSRATGNDIAKKARRLAQGKYKITPLLRLEATLNGKKLPYRALNEIFAGGKKPYHTARYKLIVGSKKEEQKSSGIIIATPTGSYAWARSAGGKLLPATSKKIQWVAREPYIGRIAKPKLAKGTTTGQVQAISEIWHHGIIVIDSREKEFPFDKGSRLAVKASKQPLNLITFD